MAHEVTVKVEGRRGGVDWHRASCSCGKYRSGLYKDPTQAQRSGSLHVSMRALVARAAEEEARQ